MPGGQSKVCTCIGPARQICRCVRAAQEVRLLQGDETRGVGGLVRMGTVEEAGRAVEALGKPHAGGGAMVVRYADSPEEKLRCAA
jgi:hypothetical protein